MQKERYMLTMAKTKKTFQFLFSTTDVDFDPSTVSVIDSKTGKEFKIESQIRAIEKHKTVVFGLRLPEGELKQVHRTAKKANVSPSDFARLAIRKAVKEREDDLQRLKKTKR